MNIRSISHRGLRRLVEEDNAQYLPTNLVSRIRNVLTALVLAENMDSFDRVALPGWRVHRLSGDRQKEWSVSVSGNWRITFQESDGWLESLDLEDYH